MKLLHTALLALPLFSLSGGVSAEWIKFQENTEFIGYADSAYSRSGNFLKVWVMRSYKSPRKIKGMMFSSTKEHAEYDCTGDRFRLLTAYWFPKTMGGGIPVDQVNIKEGLPWVSLPPDSDGKQMLEGFCSLLK